MVGDGGKRGLVMSDQAWYEDRLVGVLMSVSYKVLAYGILVPFGGQNEDVLFLLYDGELCSAPDHQAWIVSRGGGHGDSGVITSGGNRE